METVSSDGRNLICDPVPDACPVCHHNVCPTKIGVNVINFGGNSEKVVEIIYRCPNQRCQCAFIAIFVQMRDRYAVLGDKCRLRKLEPVNPKNPEVAEEIKEVSPNYAQILGQGAAAEGYGLDQIAGVGYRKALEFLVKDFAISRNRGKDDEIKNARLGNVIETYVGDAQVKQCAKLAAWLGNDETHYLRKWEEKDITDLKRLIKLTENWISSSVLTEQYLKEMAPEK